MKAADLVYLARARARLSQAELGRRATMAQNAVSRIERGEVEPGFSTVLTLLRACGYSPQILLAAADDSYARDIAQRLQLDPRQRLEQATQLARASQEMRRAGQAAGV